MPDGREITTAELILPKDFSRSGQARIELDKSTVLRIPHVDASGKLCTEADLGPWSGMTHQERIDQLLASFFTDFLGKWSAGELDGDFDKEAMNYWHIHVRKAATTGDPVKTVCCIAQRPEKARILDAYLVLPENLVIVAEPQDKSVARLIQSLGSRAKQRMRVLVADIPIQHNFIPQTWPKSIEELKRVLDCKLDDKQMAAFMPPSSRNPRSHRNNHRVALLRSPEANFAFLMPDGPPTVVGKNGKRKTTMPRTQIQPLNVDRLDPWWTVGRDQHPEVTGRQARHAVVLGAGALGSYVIDHLAKAGVGKITMVDPDDLSPANMGRHLLGVTYIGMHKVRALAKHVGGGHHSSEIIHAPMKAEKWLEINGLKGVDVVLDLTGEPSVRWHIDQSRKSTPCPLLIGWLEPYVAAAHVCILPPESLWMDGIGDRMGSLEAIDWPEEVYRQEPGCSSLFQSYTGAAATHAVALIVEQTLDVIDGHPGTARVVSWVRGQRYLDRHWMGLVLRPWAQQGGGVRDGMIIERELA